MFNYLWTTIGGNAPIACITPTNRSATYSTRLPTVCLLLDTAHKTDNVITICGKWIFDYNLEFALPITKASLNFICSGNDTDDITFLVFCMRLEQSLQ